MRAHLLATFALVVGIGAGCPADTVRGPVSTDTGSADAGADTETATATDTALGEDTRADAGADAGADADVGADADADTGIDADANASTVASCPVPTMGDHYPGPFPPSPFDPWDEAPTCVTQRHDVAIILGCPSEEDGSPSDCQLTRAHIAKWLYADGLARSFIASGGAVHTPHNEADALTALMVANGIPAEAIWREPLAEHTDENIYYASLIMADEGWTSAWVVSDAPGHLQYAALCDANCCVRKGRLTLFSIGLSAAPDGVQKIGHYALSPPGAAVPQQECDALMASGTAALCVNLAQRRACEGRVTAPAPH